MAVPQAVARTSNFVIPKKIRKEEKAVHEELFHDLLPDDPLFKSEVCRHFFDNLLNPGLRHYIRLDEARRVHNSKLFEKFLHRQQVLKRSSAPHEISYGFLLIDGDPEEEEFLCRTGLPAGYSFFGDLGRSDQGVYLSKHPDTVSPAPFFDGVPHRILIFKILRGRSKPMNFESFRDAPDPTFHSHVARHYYDSTGGGISQASPHIRFRHSQIFLFEYEGEGRYAKVLSSVYPIAIVTAIFNPPSPQTLVLLSPDETQALVWTGGLTFGGTNNVEKVELLSPRRYSSKPIGLDTTLDVREMVSWADCLAYAPICKMLTDIKAGAVVRQLEADLDDNLVVNYFTLSRPYSTKFKSIHDAMRNEHLAGVSGLPGGVHVLFIPNSELSSLLSLPRYASKRPVFHVLFFSYKPFGGSMIPSLEQGLLNSQPNPRDILNGASADAFSLFAECFERLARTQPPPPVMPVFPRGIPFAPPNMMVPPPSVFPQPMGTFDLSQPPPPPPEPPKAKEKATVKSFRDSDKAAEKSRKPYPDGGRSTGKDNSRDLYQKAMQNVGSVGKATEISAVSTSFPSAINVVPTVVSSTTSQAPLNLRDPRLRKLLDNLPVTTAPASASATAAMQQAVTSVPSTSTSATITGLPLPKVSAPSDAQQPESPTDERAYSPSQALRSSPSPSPPAMEIDEEPYSPSKAGFYDANSPESPPQSPKEDDVKRKKDDTRSLLDKINALVGSDKQETSQKPGLSFDFFGSTKESAAPSKVDRPVEKPMSGGQRHPASTEKSLRVDDEAARVTKSPSEVSFSSPIQSPTSVFPSTQLLPKSIPLERQADPPASTSSLTEDIDLRDIFVPRPPMIPIDPVPAEPSVAITSPVLPGMVSGTSFQMPDFTRPPPSIPRMPMGIRPGPAGPPLVCGIPAVDLRQPPPTVVRPSRFDQRSTFGQPHPRRPPGAPNFPSDPRSRRRSPPSQARSTQGSHQQDRGSADHAGASNSVVVILEPTLVTDFLISPEELETVMHNVNGWKDGAPSRRLVVKCHSSIEEGLREKRSLAAPGSSIESKCDRYLGLINEYTRKGLVEQMRHHSCDLPRLTPNRMLICGISNKRDRPDSRIIYLGSPATLNSETASNFKYNEIELKDIEEIDQEFGPSATGSWRQ